MQKTKAKKLEKEEEKPYIEKLAELGFSKAESLIYVYLLEKGSEALVSKIAVATRMHRQQVYLVLPKLVESGVVEEIKEGKLTKYKAKSPQSLERVVRRKITLAEDIAQELEKISKLGHEQEFEAIIGEKAYRAYDIERAKSMKEGDVQYIIGSTSDEYLIAMGDAYEKQYVPILASKNIKTYYLAPENQKFRKDYVSERQHFEVRVLSKMKESSITTMVQGNKLIFYSNVKPLSIYIIKSQKVAESYKDFFMMLWEMAEETQEKK